jgi:hypothetical protein
MAYNPAGIFSYDSVSFRFLGAHTAWFADISHEFLGLTYRTSFGTFGVNARILYTDDMDITTPLHPNGTGEKFRASEYAFGISFARQFTDRFRLGVNAKVIRSFLFNTTYGQTAFAFDIGTLYDIGYAGLKLGMVLQNLGNDLTYIREVYGIPSILSFGISAEPLRLPDHKIVVAFQTTRPSDANERFTFGIEYWFQNLLALRSGYKMTYGGDQESFAENLTAGLGVKIPIQGFDITADYAYSNYRWLPGIHRFSFEVGF